MKPLVDQLRDETAQVPPEAKDRVWQKLDAATRAVAQLQADTGDVPDGAKERVWARLDGAGSAIETLRAATDEVPVGTRQRVWRRLGSRPARVRFALAFAGAAAALGLVAWLVATPAEQTLTLDRAVVVAHRATLERGAQGPVLRRGRATVSAWGPLSMEAAGHTITTEAAVFAVQVAGTVAVQVEEGVVLLDGHRVEAGSSWPNEVQGAAFPAVRALEPPAATETRAWLSVDDALGRGDVPQALGRLDAIAARGGLRAEAALLKKAQLQLWTAHDPLGARATLAHAAASFPDGDLQQERELSTLEAAVALERWGDARADARRFLERFPASERRAEVEVISALVALQLGDRAAACAVLKTAAISQLSERQRAVLAQLRGRCEDD